MYLVLTQGGIVIEFEDPVVMNDGTIKCKSYKARIGFFIRADLNKHRLLEVDDTLEVIVNNETHVTLFNVSGKLKEVKKPLDSNSVAALIHKLFEDARR